MAIDRQDRLAATETRPLSRPLRQHIADGQRRRVGQDHAKRPTGPLRWTGWVRFNTPEASARTQNSMHIAPAGEQLFEGCCC